MGSSTLSIGFFFAFMALTLAITYWAARRTRTTEHFFAAGGQVTPWQNGWALAGDFLSAAALLGIAGIVTSNGFDGMIYSIGWLVGWPIILFLIVEPLRNVGRFTFADVVAYRLRQRPVRLAGAVGTLAVILFYLIAQMVATGSLIKLLFGLPYTWSVVVVGSVMLIYVLFGGMLATTWVQVVKAALLMGGGILLAFLVLTHFEMNPLKLFAAASEKYGTKVLQPGSKVVSGQWDAISLGLGLMFGTAAMPHVLMRAYTVKDAKAARLSILYATGLIGVFHLMVFIIGFGAMVLVGADAVAKAGGGGNMAAPLLALTVGGNAFFGFICAVAFATMLAVVAGLTLSGVATLCHDVWTNVIRNGSASEAEQLKVARVATVMISIFAIFLGIAFEGQNVAFMAGPCVLDRLRCQLSLAGARHHLAPLHDACSRGEHPRRHAELAGADLSVADHPTRHSRQAAGRGRASMVVRVAAQSGDYQHAVVLRGRDLAIAGHDGEERQSRL
ncbi:cation/acetate symporter [Bradyrhizobium sp. JR3.5]